MLEHKNQKVVSRTAFIKRIIVYIGFALLLILISLGIGISGYHWIAGLKWIDSLREWLIHGMHLLM